MRMSESVSKTFPLAVLTRPLGESSSCENERAPSEGQKGKTES